MQFANLTPCAWPGFGLPGVVEDPHAAIASTQQAPPNAIRWIRLHRLGALLLGVWRTST
jgi:hypothetical protein